MLKNILKNIKILILPLTNNDYNNRMIHIASESNSSEILNMLIALKS